MADKWIEISKESFDGIIDLRNKFLVNTSETISFVLCIEQRVIIIVFVTDKNSHAISFDTEENMIKAYEKIKKELM